LKKSPAHNLRKKLRQNGFRCGRIEARGQTDMISPLCSGALYLHGAQGKLEFGGPLSKEKTNKEHFELNFIVTTKQTNYTT
jgi:hypothetical protein